MIDAAKLYQMQYSQIQNYSTEYHSLDKLKNLINIIIRDRTLSSDQKLNFLSNYIGSFDIQKNGDTRIS